MAARKKSAESMTLFVAPAPMPASAPQPPSTPRSSSPEPPKLRLAFSRPDNDVTIEPAEQGGFWVSRTRADGTTSATVHYTRAELEMLLRRIPAALEVG